MKWNLQGIWEVIYLLCFYCSLCPSLFGLQVLQSLVRGKKWVPKSKCHLRKLGPYLVGSLARYGVDTYSSVFTQQLIVGCIVDPLEIRATMLLFYPAISRWVSLWELCGDEWIRYQMSSQKASTTLHWFSARYGDNTHNLDMTMRFRVVMDPLEIRLAISLFYPAISSWASLWKHYED